MFPVCGLEMVVPRSWDTSVMSGFTTRLAPPEVAPAMIRTAVPWLLTNALIEGLGPM